MSVRPLLIIVLVFSFYIPVISGADAGHENSKVTPYGDYCSRISHYGMHKSIIDMKHAEEALKHYYGEKGLDVEVVSREGRFIKAIVKDEHAVVDTIIFDRNTGRLRSVY